MRKHDHVRLALFGEQTSSNALVNPALNPSDSSKESATSDQPRASSPKSQHKELRYPPTGIWPPVMRADMAAAYVDERSVETFLRKVGSVYPGPIRGKGRRGFWSKASLDAVASEGIATDDISELI